MRAANERAIGFDRDLSIAGRAMVKDGKDNFVQKLVKIDRPSERYSRHKTVDVR
jgi:aspartyl aminopeptidase